MCILFIAVQQHPQYPLIIAANRDEFYQRPTRSSDFWPEDNGVLAGKDLTAGGTWMGINKTGFLSALTNIRAPHLNQENAISRGALVLGYLQEQRLPKHCGPEGYVGYLHHSRAQFNGYNLLFGHWQDLAVYNNHEDSLQYLSPGFYGLSNANLNSPWPKINMGVQALKSFCSGQNKIDTEELFQLLRNEEKAADHLLPETGAPEHWEKQLSSIFINVPGYGTRSSTLLCIDAQEHVTWHERIYDENAIAVQDQQVSFTIAD